VTLAALRGADRLRTVPPVARNSRPVKSAFLRRPAGRPGATWRTHGMHVSEIESPRRSRLGGDTSLARAENRW